MRLTATLAWSLLFVTPSDGPVGNWKMVIKVGHVGEGLRTVILEVSEADDGYHGQLTSMQNRMTDADEVTFDNDVLTVWYGSYEYELTIDGDTAAGTVTSPAGTQQVTAKRQESQLFAGDAPEPYQKTWRGKVERRDDAYVIVTRRNTFELGNASDHEQALSELSGVDVTVTGLWRVDKIEIVSIARGRE